MKKHLSFMMLLAMLLCISSNAFATTVQIGTSEATPNNRFLPIQGGKNYSYTQQLYYPSEINMAGEIIKLGFWYTSGAIANSKDWTIYMGHTSQDQFATNTSWIDNSTLFPVFSGDVSSLFITPTGWKELTLDIPFYYNNIDNLVIAIKEDYPGRGNVNWGIIPSGSVNRAIQYADNNTDPDPNDPPVATMLNASVSRVQLVFPDGDLPMAPLLLFPENNSQILEGQSLSWTLPDESADALAYDVYINDRMVSEHQTESTYTLEAMDPGVYTWYVMAHNEIGSSDISEIGTFEFVKGAIIGAGRASSTNPFISSYGFGRSLGLYNYSEIGTYGMITTLGWEVETRSTAELPYKIYAQATDNLMLLPHTWDAFTSSATVIKEGSYTFDSTGWHNFALDTPFLYTQGNLLIGVEVNVGGIGASSAPRFRYTPESDGLHQSWISDLNPPTSNGEIDGKRPNMLLALTALSVDPMLTISPAGWDFGRCLVNDALSKSFNIINVGNGSLNVTGISPLSNGYFEIIDAPTFPVALSLGEATSFSIKYEPTSAGNHAANFQISDENNSTDLNVSAEGYHFTISNFPYLEDFEAHADNSLPTGWSRSSNALGWRLGTDLSSYYWDIPAHTVYAAANDDEGGNSSDGSVDYLNMPIFDLSGITEGVPVLSFDSFFTGEYGHLATVEASTDGANWRVVYDVPNNNVWENHGFGLVDYIGETQLYIRFHSDDNGNWATGWAIDNVKIEIMSGDALPPTIAHLPLINTPRDDADYIVSAVIVDDAAWNNPIAGAQLYYDAGDGEVMVNMLAGADDLYTAAIPAQELGTWIEYYIKAWDSEDNITQTDEYGFIVENPVWIYYSGGPTTFMGSSGSTFGAGIVFENPFYGSGNPLQVLAVDSYSFNNTTAVLMVYEFDGATLTPAMSAVNVNLPADYAAFDLEALEVYIESPMFAVTYQNVPSGNYFAWDEDINYHTSIFNSGSGWGFLTNDGTWCFGALVTNALNELDAPEVNIALIDGDVVLDWNPVDGAASYHVLGSDDPYTADPWTLLNSVSTPEYTYSGSEAMQYFKVIADSDAATKGRRQIIRPERQLNNVINKTKRNIELGKPMKMLLK